MLTHPFIAGLLLVAFSTLTGPVAAQTKVLRVVPHADLTQLDPVFAAILITREYGLMIYEELFAWDAKLQPKPQMVESWTTSPDSSTTSSARWPASPRWPPRTYRRRRTRCP